MTRTKPDPFAAAIEYIERHEQLRRWLLEDGPQPYLVGGSSGPYRCSADVCSAGIRVSHFSDAAWFEECAYHDWCGAHGYSIEARAQCPHTASGRRDLKTLFTWSQLRVELEQREAGQQALF